MGTTSKKTILLIATLDTKAAEASFLKSAVESQGCSVILMNPGVLASPPYAPDIDRLEIAKAAGKDLDALLASKDKGKCINAMMEGSAILTKKLYDEGRIHGVVSIGGDQGTNIGSTAMRSLPFGVPKFMVSTVATGRAKFGEYTKTKDIIIMHSVADIAGLNRVTRSVMWKAAVCIAAMANSNEEKVVSVGGKIPVAMSMLGTTTQGAMRAIATLESKGYEVVAFHQNGTGGIAMEDMIREGVFKGVLDLNTHEIGDRVVQGLHGAIADYRLESAGAMGLPQVVAPGSAYYTVQGPEDELPPNMQGRKLIVHNVHHTLVRLNDEELAETARITARKLNAAKGPLHFFIPLKGMAYPDREGLGHWDPEADRAFYSIIKSNLNPKVPVTEIDAHINDPEFIDPVVEKFLFFMEGRV
jgi:uncharacterized protein (UPF0261 family)